MLIVYRSVLPKLKVSATNDLQKKIFTYPAHDARFTFQEMSAGKPQLTLKHPLCSTQRETESHKIARKKRFTA